MFRFRRDLRVVHFDEERVFLLGQRESFLLREKLHVRLAHLLDGTRTAAELVQALGGEATSHEVLHALLILQSKGYVVAERPDFSPGGSAYWDAVGPGADVAREKLQNVHVSVSTLSEDDPTLLVSALAGAGISVRDVVDSKAFFSGSVESHIFPKPRSEDEVQLILLLVDDYLSEPLRAFNILARRHQRRFLPIRIRGVAPWLGPIFGAEGGPCWECLAVRLRRNRPIESYVRARTGQAPVALSPLPAVSQMALHFTAAALAGWITSGGKGALVDSLLEIDPTQAKLLLHPVQKRPQCSVCGVVEWISSRSNQPIAITSRPKRFFEDGGHRIAAPEETLATYERLVNPITGILADLHPVEQGAHPLRQVVSAIHHVCPETDAPSLSDFYQLSSGKGRSAAQARASALCEGVERYSAVFQGDEARVLARPEQLAGPAILPSQLQPFSDRQRNLSPADSAEDVGISLRAPMRNVGAAPPSAAPRAGQRRTAPKPYDGRPIEWTPMWSLRDKRHLYVPTTFCYFHVPTPAGERFCLFDSNGLAAGNCLEEAILQGFLELVERDAVAIWWYNRLTRPRVELRSFGDSYLTELARHYRSLGVSVWVIDVTLDLQIPTFVAIGQAGERFWIGCGCHFDAKLGVQRALTELNQGFDLRGEGPLSWAEADFVNTAYLKPDSSLDARVATDYPSVARDDLREDVFACVDIARRKGLDTLILDMTRPDIGLSVVRVVVPGLRHFWPRFGPGRLYDVPVELGLRKGPLTEEELNPVHYLF